MRVEFVSRLVVAVVDQWFDGRRGTVLGRCCDDSITSIRCVVSWALMT